jgi:hypothetical protein
MQIRREIYFVDLDIETPINYLGVAFLFFAKIFFNGMKPRV